MKNLFKEIYSEIHLFSFLSHYPDIKSKLQYTYSPSEMLKIKQGLINVSSLSVNSHTSPSVFSFTTFFHIKNAISEQPF